MPPAPPTSCLELLQAMVRFDSVTPRTSGRPDAEQPLGAYVAGLASGWGLAVTELHVPGGAPNVLVTGPRQPDAPWWLFDSHLDTVGIEGMTVDPLGAHIEGGRLYGRGACDTKGTGAAMLWALREAAAAGTAPANLALLFTVGEEARQVGARAFLERDLAKLGWSPAAVVVGEPTQMNVVRAANGYVRIRLATHGRAAHSSSPEQGLNAISTMARAVTAIEDQYIARLDATHPLTGRSTCSINVIRGGSEHNVVPPRCEVTIDHRLTPGQDGEQALAGIRAALDALAARDNRLEYSFDDVETAPPMGPELNGPLSEHVASVLNAAGIASTVHGAPYTTNANHYGGAGLKCVVLGPGDIAQAHTKDEWISLEQLQLGVQGYRALMESLPQA